MNKKLLSISAIVIVFAFGFLYLNQAYLVAHDKGSCDKECTQKTAGKTCDKSSCDKLAGDKSGCDKSNCDKSSCGENKSQVKAGGEYSSYQFVTDKAGCEDSKAELQKNLLSVAGVKEVSFGSTCNVSKMTNVTVMYSAGETSEENIASYLKNRNLDCSGKGCDKEGKNDCPGMKEKKSSDSKQL